MEGRFHMKNIANLHEVWIVRIFHISNPLKIQDELVRLELDMAWEYQEYEPHTLHENDGNIPILSSTIWKELKYKKNSYNKISLKTTNFFVKNIYFSITYKYK